MKKTIFIFLFVGILSPILGQTTVSLEEGRREILSLTLKSHRQAGMQGRVSLNKQFLTMEFLAVDIIRLNQYTITIYEADEIIQTQSIREANADIIGKAFASGVSLNPELSKYYKDLGIIYLEIIMVDSNNNKYSSGLYMFN